MKEPAVVRIPVAEAGMEIQKFRALAGFNF
jgi:hypothetical protein